MNTFRTSRIVLDPVGFDDWQGLLTLLKREFAHTIGKVDPPSTVYQTSPQDLQLRAAQSHLLLAYDGTRLIGCLFLDPRPHTLFLGRFAVDQTARGSGLARRMIEQAELLARQYGLATLSLETRTALEENQVKFKSLGFRITGGRAHDGYDEITTLRMTMPVRNARLLRVGT